MSRSNRYARRERYLHGSTSFDVTFMLDDVIDVINKYLVDWFRLDLNRIKSTFLYDHFDYIIKRIVADVLCGHSGAFKHQFTDTINETITQFIIMHDTHSDDISESDVMDIRNEVDDVVVKITDKLTDYLSLDDYIITGYEYFDIEIVRSSIRVKSIGDVRILSYYCNQSNQSLDKCYPVELIKELVEYEKSYLRRLS